MNRRIILSASIVMHCMALLSPLLLAASSFADETEKKAPVISVGVSHFPPLVIETKDSPDGFDMEIWRAIVERIGQPNYEVTFYPFPQLLDELEKGTIDVALAGISITAKREKQFDFSIPYLNAGLMTLRRNEINYSILSAVLSLFSTSTLYLLIYFIAFIVFCGHLLWFSERGADAIDDKYFPGIFEAFWCVVATATTVGYGDIAPRKWLGRFAALFVMLAGIGFFGIISAELMSSLTTQKLSEDISSHLDLQGKPVATVKDTTSVDALARLGATVKTTETIERAYDLLELERVDAVVFDAPILEHYVSRAGAGKFVLAGNIFEEQYYGIAMRNGSPLREDISKAILELRESGQYDRIFDRWFSR